MVPVEYRSFIKRTGTRTGTGAVQYRSNTGPYRSLLVVYNIKDRYWNGIGHKSTVPLPVLYCSVPFRYRSILKSNTDKFEQTSS